MKTYYFELESGRIMSTMPQHKKKVAKARQDISEMISMCSSTYVSVSWGKDSTVLAHLVLSIDNNVPLVHWSSEQEKHISNFDVVRDDFLTRFGGKYIDVKDDDLMSGKLRNAGKEWSLSNGYDGVFIGLTKEESKARKYTLSMADKNNIFTYTDGFRRSCPLADWTVEDITAYVAANELKMLNLYERYGMNTRTSSRIKQSGATRAGLEYLTSTQQAEVKQFWSEK